MVGQIKLLAVESLLAGTKRNSNENCPTITCLDLDLGSEFIDLEFAK